MKKLICAWVVLLLICAPAMGLASENLYASALFEDDAIVYSGSLDGEERGVFRMNLDGSNAKKIYHTEALLLAADDGVLAIGDYDAGQLVLITEGGQEVGRVDGYFDMAAVDDGVFYVNNQAVTVKGGKVEAKELFDVGEGNEWYISPIEVEDGYVYYYDSSKYGAVSAVEGSGHVAALCRMNVKTGEHQTISPEGTTFLGIEDGQIFYTREDFYIFTEDDEAKEMTNDEGLFKAALDGSGETKLAGFEENSESITTRYQLVEDSVIYGLTTDYSRDEDQPVNTLKRVTFDGQTLPDVPVPYGVLCSADDEQVIMCTYNVDFTGEDYNQSDRILVLDTNTGAYKTLNEDGKLVLFFFEADPELIVEDDRLFGFTYDYDRSAMALFSMKTDGSDIRELAKGYSWAE